MYVPLRTGEQSVTGVVATHNTLQDLVSGRVLTLINPLTYSGSGMTGQSADYWIIDEDD